MSIDITGVDLKAFAKKVYELSKPQGLGLLHYQSGSLSDAEAERLLLNRYGNTVLDMDYVHGRACKMHVWKEGETLCIQDSWYDHTDEQLAELLLAFNLVLPSKSEHGYACTCADCRNK